MLFVSVKRFLMRENKRRKMGVREIKLRSIITYEIESLFCYLNRTGLIQRM